ncbi:MAG: hypothetical protein JWN44_680 [Myxococcales bacterium]|nr:hypothetical protein [Myxococcales bacterium]
MRRRPPGVRLARIILLIVAACAARVAQAQAQAQVPVPSQAPAQAIDALESAAPKPPNVVPQAREEPPRRLPLAGYANGSFFLRDPNDWFVLFPKGRLQIDWYNFLNRGATPEGVTSNSGQDTRPKDTLFIRRARIELQGTFIGHFDFTIAGEFVNLPSTGSYGTLNDGYIIVDYLSFLKLQVGQYDLPFTLENRTSDKLFDFMERSTAIRAFAVPAIKDLGAMVWGWLPREVAYYSVGVFNGDGPNFKNQDNNPALIGRAFVAPVAWMRAAERHGWMKRIEVGASFWWQQNTNLGGAAAPSTDHAQDDLLSMTTQGGVSFFNSSFAAGVDGSGNAIRSHLAPWGTTTKWAVEASVPIGKLGARFELIHQSLDLAQYNDAPNVKTLSLSRAEGVRGGRLDGFAYYIELYAWILGDTMFLDQPGLEPVPHIRRFAVAREPRWGLMVAVKYEHLGMDVSGLPVGTLNSMGQPMANPAQGHYELHTFALGLNAWGTKHVRLTANYVVNYIDGDAPNVTKNLFYQRLEHELLFRLAVGL